MLTLPSTRGWKGSFFFDIELKSTSCGGAFLSAMAREDGSERAASANPVGAAAGQGMEWGERRGFCGGVLVFDPCGFGWNGELDYLMRVCITPRSVIYTL
jgi:hypothetical protein